MFWEDCDAWEWSFDVQRPQSGSEGGEVLYPDEYVLKPLSTEDYMPGSDWFENVTIAPEGATLVIFVPKDLVLENQTVKAGETKSFEAQDTITAGNNFVVEDSANATFKAGKKIRLRDGFRSQRGSHFQAKIE